MPGAAEEYPALARYRQELPPGAVVHEVGVIPPCFYMVLVGRVVLDAIDAHGAPSIAGEVHPGGLLGVGSVFSGRPTEARARTVTRSTLLAVPLAAAAVAFRAAPEFAVAVVRQLATGSIGAPAVLPLPVIGQPAEVVGALPPLPSFNEQWFFKADTQCPACLAVFSFAEVRSSVVRPVARDSDFRIAYETVDPSLYAVTVCPRCAYASYNEDFTELPPAERRAIQDSMAPRLALMVRALCGERDLADAMLSLVLAQMCADARGAHLRRHAGLLHRRAWIERARGDIEAERALTQRTRDAYLAIFEQDPDVQDAAVVRVAYLLGDLSLRLSDPAAGRRWLLECLRMPAGKEQAGLVAMARQRLADANEALGLARSA